MYWLEYVRLKYMYMCVEASWDVMFSVCVLNWDRNVFYVLRMVT